MAKRAEEFSELSFESAAGRIGVNWIGDVKVENVVHGEDFGSEKHKISRIEFLAGKVCFLWVTPYLSD